MTKSEIIKNRVVDSFQNVALKHAAYRMRKFVIGDEAAIGGNINAAGSDDSLRLKKSNPKFPLFRLSSHQKGVFNPILRWLTVLIDTLTISQPAVIFPDLSVKVGKVREAWIQSKLEAADWIPHQTRFLHSYLVDGISFWKIGYWDDRLGIRSVDLLNLYWDLNPDLPSESQWVAEQVCVSTATAKKLIGEEALRMLTQKPLDPYGEERIMLIEYWDRTTLAYLHPNGSKVLKRKDNPYGCVPYECMFGDLYPSLYMPIPHVARSIGISTAITELSRTIMERVRTGRSILEVDPTAFTPDSMADFREAGQDVEYMVRSENSEGREGIRYVTPPDISAELINLMKMFEETLVPLFGVNPAAGGYSPQADFAAQVVAIQSQSDLTTKRMAEEYALCLARAFRKLVKIGARFDDEDFTTSQGGTSFSFGREFPIEPVLRADVPCQVSPGIQENPALRQLKLQQLWTLITPDLRMKYPNLERELLSETLLQAGLNDIEQLLDQPNPENINAIEDPNQTQIGI